MPEGHVIHRLARELRTHFADTTPEVSSPARRATPKSVSLTSPDTLMSTLWGEMSRWMISAVRPSWLSPWAYSSAVSSSPMTARRDDRLERLAARAQAGEQLVEAAAVDPLHDEHQALADDAGVEHLHDVRM